MHVTEVVTLVISIVSLCTSISVFYWQRRHGDFDLARLLHADLTGGEVAKARDVLGALVHTPGSIRDDVFPEVRTAYFTLLWCFERLYAGRRAIQDGGTASRRPLRFLDRLISSQLAYWAVNLPRVRGELERRLGPIEDEQSLWAFEELKRSVLPARQEPPHT
ncbi:hypothetical protein SAMN04487981_12933 [Streptomyces sp. cf386]|uniref:hypothetical protein n=1 Tax=Streptomyces sp. cf386 TaxID=1761904 RepID=UPI00088408ED|nr:hypothetical protein [Streptomyces sp. cf386]SDP62095.1 hypothetical protein SAMN04487981_12933 [Streptomyces sp. cf386]